MQNVKRLITMAVIFVLLMLIIVCIAAKSARSAEKGICTIECINNTNLIYIFRIDWINHPYKHLTRGKPWLIALGEVNPGESWKLRYLPGLYKVGCYLARVPPSSKLYRQPKSGKFAIKPYVSKVTITILIIEDELEMFLIYGYGL